jgi:hypothetical protein
MLRDHDFLLRTLTSELELEDQVIAAISKGAMGSRATHNLYDLQFFSSFSFLLQLQCFPLNALCFFADLAPHREFFF